MAVSWNSYLSIIQTLRDYVKSIKTGDWDLDIFASEKMLHCFTTSEEVQNDLFRAGTKQAK